MLQPRPRWAPTRFGDCLVAAAARDSLLDALGHHCRAQLPSGCLTRPPATSPCMHLASMDGPPARRSGVRQLGTTQARASVTWLQAACGGPPTGAEGHRGGLSMQTHAWQGREEVPQGRTRGEEGRDVRGRRARDRSTRSWCVDGRGACASMRPISYSTTGKSQGDAAIGHTSGVPHGTVQKWGMCLCTSACVARVPRRCETSDTLGGWAPTPPRCPNGCKAHHTAASLLCRACGPPLRPKQLQRYSHQSTIREACAQQQQSKKPVRVPFTAALVIQSSYVSLMTCR